MGGPHRAAASGRPPYVRDKRRRLGLLRRVNECLVPECWFWLLVQNGLTGGVEEPNAATVDIAAGLCFQRIRGVQQPERCPDRGGPGGQTEQPAHDVPSRPSDRPGTETAARLAAASFAAGLPGSGARPPLYAMADTRGGAYRCRPGAEQE